MSGVNDNRNFFPIFSDLVQRGGSIHFRHDQIQQQDVRNLAANLFERFQPVSSGAHIVLLGGEQRRKDGEDFRVVIHHQNIGVKQTLILGQDERKRAAPAQFALHLNGAAMQLDQFPAQIEAQSHSL